MKTKTTQNKPQKTLPPGEQFYNNLFVVCGIANRMGISVEGICGTLDFTKARIIQDSTGPSSTNESSHGQ